MELNIFIALFAGFISFLSPCIFPLIPSYIAYIGAASFNDGMQRNKGSIPLILSFIIGFTVVFTIMGVVISTLGFAFRSYSLIINRVSGILVIILGLNTIFNFLKFLDYEKKATVTIKNKNIISSLLLGMAFGAGWSPCIGPILASILLLAGNSQTLAGGIILLLFFSLGLAIPFFLSGIFISKFKEKSSYIKQHLGKIKIISGLLITLIGILIFSNRLSNINTSLNYMASVFITTYSNKKIFIDTIFSLFFIFIGLFPFLSIKSRKKEKKNIIIPIIIILMFFSVSFFSFSGAINWGNIVGNYLSFQGI
ncbi:MAG: sulfite exporter TauE/SafE family protein [Spirochaetales bacterium]|nr:sulfite exporter TauE/SafE family protein [Spirochaetales bacterium]